MRIATLTATIRSLFAIGNDRRVIVTANKCKTCSHQSCAHRSAHAYRAWLSDLAGTPHLLPVVVSSVASRMLSCMRPPQPMLLASGVQGVFMESVERS